jgi:hypothetical protein
MCFGGFYQICSQGNLLDITLPFEGDIADKCEEIFKLPQYQPIQKIQLVLNEAAKRICESEKEILENRKIINETQNYSRREETECEYGQILFALLNEFREYADIERGSNFAIFIADKCANIDPILTNLPTTDFPQQFFSISSIDERMKVVASLVADNTPISSLLQSQFLINNYLRKQMRDAAASQVELNTTQITEITEKQDQQIKSLQEKVVQLKESRKQLHNSLKQAQGESKTEQECRSKLSALEIQLESVQHENELLKVKVQVAQNELLLKMKDPPMSQSNLSEISNEPRLEAALAAKSDECSQLGQQMRKLQATLEETIKKNAKKYRSREEAMRGEIENLQNEVAAIVEESQSRMKKMKKLTKQTKEQYQATINEMVKNHEESKATLEGTVRAMTEKAEESRAMSQQLVQSLTQCEQKNQKLQSELQQTTQSQKDLALQQSVLKQQIAKDRQNYQAQIAAQQLAAEARLQDICTQLRSQYEKRIANLLNTALTTIGAFYGVDETSFTEDGFAQIVAHAKADLTKLKYFQAETTRYKPAD